MSLNDKMKLTAHEPDKITPMSKVVSPPMPEKHRQPDSKPYVRLAGKVGERIARLESENLELRDRFRVMGLKMNGQQVLLETQHGHLRITEAWIEDVIAENKELRERVERLERICEIQHALLALTEQNRKRYLTKVNVAITTPRTDIQEALAEMLENQASETESQNSTSRKSHDTEPRKSGG